MFNKKPISGVEGGAYVRGCNSDIFTPSNDIIVLYVLDDSSHTHTPTPICDSLYKKFHVAILGNVYSYASSSTNRCGEMAGIK